ncbi:GNAT family N-acetyltransferase [Kribbella sp. NPDC051952]|uniref:GNAT family N-acetyltransferase n=1 Tax=Kribbella sp. NPDC051952 TaxID=3154851 RepID=UPI003435FBFB
MELATLGTDEWQVLRELLLRALKDSPAAYISDYESEAARTETGWRERFVNVQWVVARLGDRTIGLAAARRVEDRAPDERHIESVWVDPRHRRTGVLRAMLRHLMEMEPSVRTWLVWVLDDNLLGRRVYERLGFRSTLESQPLEDGTGRRELRLGFWIAPRSG